MSVSLAPLTAGSAPTPVPPLAPAPAPVAAIAPVPKPVAFPPAGVVYVPDSGSEPSYTYPNPAPSLSPAPPPVTYGPHVQAVLEPAAAPPLLSTDLVPVADAGTAAADVQTINARTAPAPAEQAPAQSVAQAAYAMVADVQAARPDGAGLFRQG